MNEIQSSKNNIKLSTLSESDFVSFYSLSVFKFKHNLNYPISCYIINSNRAAMLILFANPSELA